MTPNTLWNELIQVIRSFFERARRIATVWIRLVLLNFALYLTVVLSTGDNYVLLAQQDIEQPLLTLVLVWGYFNAYHILFLVLPSVAFGAVFKASTAKWIAVGVALGTWLAFDVLFSWTYLNMELFLSLDAAMILGLLLGIVYQGSRKQVR